VSNPAQTADSSNGTQAQPARNIFGNQAFSGYLVLRFVSLVGDGAWWIALAWEAGRLAHGTGIGLVMGIGGVPRLLLSFVGGSLADYFGVKRTMIVSDLSAAVISAMTAVLWFTRGAPLAVLIAVALCFGIVDAFYGPSSMAFARALLADDELARGSSLRQTASSVAQLLGTLAGGLIVTVGFGWVAAFDSATFIVVGAGLAFIRPGRRHFVQRPVAGEQIRGMRHAVGRIRRSPVLRGLLFSSLIVNACGMALINVGIVARVQQLGWPSSALAAIDMLMAVGLIVSGIGFAKWRGPVRPGIAIILSSVLAGALTLGVFTSSNLLLSCVLSFLSGIFLMPVGALSNALAMKSAPSDMVGALNGAIMTVSMGSMPLGSFAFGILAATWGLGAAGYATGLTLIGGCLCLLGIRSLTNATLTEEQP